MFRILSWLTVGALALHLGAAPVKKSVSAAKPAPAKSNTKSQSSARQAPQRSTSPAARKGAAAKGATNTAASRRRRSTLPHFRAGQQQPTPDRIREIQSALIQRGYLQGEADGTWGASTIDALRRFQADQNLTADGKLNSMSLIALGLGPKRNGLAAAAVKPPRPVVNPDTTPETTEATIPPAALEAQPQEKEPQ